MYLERVEDKLASKRLEGSCHDFHIFLCTSPGRTPPLPSSVVVVRSVRASCHCGACHTACCEGGYGGCSVGVSA